MTWLEDATRLAIAAWTLATCALVWMTVRPAWSSCRSWSGSSASCGGEAGWRAGGPDVPGAGPAWLERQAETAEQLLAKRQPGEQL